MGTRDANGKGTKRAKGERVRKGASGAGKPSRRSAGSTVPARSRRASVAPITFFVALIIVVLGSIQLISTFHTYALNLAELNALRNQESQLIAKKAKLDNDIERWDDDAYVTAQARERLGFVFPGERSVRILHPEAVTGKTTDAENQGGSSPSSEQTLPWYRDMFSAFGKADKRPAAASEDGSSRSGKTDGNSAEDSNGGTAENGGTANTDTKEGQ
ncbi:FtsB family cell division protein [Bifidobacterium catulorum]|uniref:Septum formation initiator n=1 Tax=Bifidobacterium catulorum TaxID=1630173 RepID=A0A2U2MVQ9_9BIFI|nr:septum formation initiator family protein [Bifidobacterium catulorum]PWG60886.1 septum formation initiator [Bifidobacterium catulorum]